MQAQYSFKTQFMISLSLIVIKSCLNFWKPSYLYLSTVSPDVKNIRFGKLNFILDVLHVIIIAVIEN